jgi:hypothetical protein
MYIVVCGFAHMKLLRLVDLQCCLCVWSFASVTMLRIDTVFSIIVFVGAYSGKLFDSTVLAVNCTVHTLKLKY